jgi:hypothetical protein
MGFYGDCSRFVELPKPDEIYDYEKLKDPYWTLNVNEDEKKEEKMSEETNSFKFTL